MKPEKGETLYVTISNYILLLERKLYLRCAKNSPNKPQPIFQACLITYMISRGDVKHTSHWDRTKYLYIHVYKIQLHVWLATCMFGYMCGRLHV